MEENTFLRGEIRKPSNRQRIMKVLAGDSEVFIEGESRADIDLFIPIGNVPFHYVVIEGRYTNFLDSQDKFYSVRLITHSDSFDNLKIQNNWLEENSNNFVKVDSYITQDKFIIREQDIEVSEKFGIIDLGQVEDSVS